MFYFQQSFMDTCSTQSKNLFYLHYVLQFEVNFTTKLSIGVKQYNKLNIDN